MNEKKQDTKKKDWKEKEEEKKPKDANFVSLDMALLRVIEHRYPFPPSLEKKPEIIGHTPFFFFSIYLRNISMKNTHTQKAKNNEIWKPFIIG